MAFEWLKKLFEKDDKKDSANKSGGTQSSLKSTASKTTGKSSSVSKSTSVLPTVTAKSSSTSTAANKQTGSTPSLLESLQKSTPKETLLKSQSVAAAPQKTQQQQSPLQQSRAKTLAAAYMETKVAELLAKKMQETMQQSDENKAQQSRTTTAYQKPAQKKTSARSSASAVAQYGSSTSAVAQYDSSEDYALVEKAAARVDFSDWGSKNTTQQRAALKRSGLTEEEQWTLLNKDGNYLETLYNISDIQANRLSYGLSQQEAEQKSAELLFLAAARANATGNDQPYLSKIPRAQMVDYLDAKKDNLLQSIVNPDSHTVGGDGRVWYDEEKENISAYPLPTPNPNITPNPQTTPDPKITPLPQPGPELHQVGPKREAAKELDPMEELKILADDPEMSEKQQTEIGSALRQIENGQLSESQQKKLLKETKKNLEKLEAIKIAPEPEW